MMDKKLILIIIAIMLLILLSIYYQYYVKYPACMEVFNNHMYCLTK